MLELIFWLMIALVLYSYLGYGLAVFLWGKAVSPAKPRGDGEPDVAHEPTVCLLVASFNEEPWIEKKIRNSLQLDYPPEKLRLVWVTDGAESATLGRWSGHPAVTHLHQAERKGKIAAINRAMQVIDAEIVVLSDANALLPPGSVRAMLRHFRDPAVGCVAGEKRIQTGPERDVAANGESLYWRYESWIKKQEARIGSCIGACGDLFAIRRTLFPVVPEDTLVEDFVMSMDIALRGYRVAYCPEACAIESPSASVADEFRRKTRIAAGNLQCLLRMPGLVNLFRHGHVAAQYISHKALRSFVVPLLLPALVVLNIALLPGGAILPGPVYAALLAMQVLFYALALLGACLDWCRLPTHLFGIPYYVTMMNVASLVGCWRYVAGRQSVRWAKARRRDEP